MNEKNMGTQGAGITLSDVVYAVFRHKWKILIISGLGIIAAAALPFFTPHEYRSEAKLFVKYVVDAKSPQVGTSTVTSDDGGNAINTEMEILTSQDLALQVADLVGPEKILAKAGGGTNRYTAAEIIHKGLIPESGKGSKVIHVTFKHPDPEVAQVVLTQVIKEYLTRHDEIHRHIGAYDDFLTQQTDQLKSRLKDTEDQLRKAKSSAGIISLDYSKKAFFDQISAIQSKITDAEAELAERKATAEEMAKLLHTTAPTNDTSHSSEVAAVPADKIAEYRKLCTLLDGLHKRELDLLAQFTPENSFVKEVQEQIANKTKVKEDLELANPALLGVRPETTASGQDPAIGLRTTLVTEAARAKALQYKIEILTGQLAKIRKDAGVIDLAEASITDLERTRNLQEKNYTYFKENLEQSKFDQALGAGRANNISIIQNPSPTFVISKLPKTMAMVAFGAIAVAFGLAFLIEFYFDKSIKRPIEISTKLGLPLFISIPQLRLTAKHALNGKQSPLLAEHAEKSKPAGSPSETTSTAVALAPSKNGTQDTEIAPWDPRFVLRPFCEALRDRLITFFDVNNFVHKPKLVAVTSVSDGSGVSTVASGLAASLSETGEGNVLLVNMTENNGSVHQFYKGDLACGLDDILENKNREQALVRDNLYVVSEASNDGLPLPLPKRFKNLMPKLRASDYDYIIFDLPAVSQVSVTPRLARFMDFVVMVVESEHTNREVVKQACSWLKESKANVGVVLNKNRNYLPKWLNSDL